MKSIVVGTAGHIDHGKSALVQALTGTDPDRLKEEKARGITIDLGFAHAVIEGLAVAFVDVPGHEQFVKNMLAGVGGIDLVVLVVAADESVMPQTREHFDICRLLQVPVGIVALTKSDLVDDETLSLVRLEVRELVAGSFLEHAPVVPVSSKTGEGLDAFRAALVTAAAAAKGRSADGAARLPIDRVFSMKGFGTVVTGTLVSGTVRVDDELMLLPGDRRAKVRGVQVHGKREDAALAGQRAAVNLAGVDVEEISRGQNLTAPDAAAETRLADAVLELLPDANPLKHGARVRFHQGTAEILGRVSIVGPAGEGSQTLKPGAKAFVRLRLERAAVLSRGDRFILRAYSPAITIAGGQILDPLPPRTAVRTQAAVGRFKRLDPAAAADRVDAEIRAVAAMIDSAGGAGLPVAALASRAGVEPPHLALRVDALVARGLAARIGDSLVAPAIIGRVSSDLVALLGAHHAAQPLSEGLPREEARERVLPHGHPALFEHVLDELGRAGTVGGRDRLALATHRVALSPEEKRAHDALEDAFRSAGLKPADAAAVARDAKVPSAVADRVIKLLLRQKILVKVDVLLFHRDALDRLKADVTALKASGGKDARLDVAAFKDRFGVSRKFAIPLLEYLDRERVTRRVGEARVIL